jgi:hypothetical protein
LLTLPFASILGTQGDVFLSENGPVTDVIRFNGNRTIVFYAGSLPLSFYRGNRVSPWTAYIPQPGQPGFGFSDDGTRVTNYLTYVFHSWGRQK